MPWLNSRDKELKRLQHDVGIDFLQNSAITTNRMKFDLYTRMARFMEIQRSQPKDKNFKSYLWRPFFDLPQELLPINGSLEEIILKRNTRREFSDRALTLAEISTLFRLSYGEKINDKWCSDQQPSPDRKRAVASAGALYPLELYYIPYTATAELPGGQYHYNVRKHGLEQISQKEFNRESLKTITPGIGNTNFGAGIIVITTVYRRSLEKYGLRGCRFLLYEVGEVIAHINLACAGLGLGSQAFGGGFDDAMEKYLGIDPATECYLSSVYVGGV